VTILDTIRQLAWRLLGGRPTLVGPDSGGASSGKPLSTGIDGMGGVAEWNPWARYQNPISAFFDFYEQNPWVRGVCDAIADEINIDGWQLVDETTTNGTHPEMARLDEWLRAIGFDDKRHQAALDLAICYNAFFYIERNGLRQIRNLIRIPPHTMKPVGSAETGVIAWKQTVGSKSKIFPVSDIWHIKGPNPVTDVIGLPKLTSAAVEVEADEAMANFNRAYFGNGTQAGTILTWDQTDLRNPKTGEWTDTDEKKAANLWAQMSAYIERRFTNPASAHLPLLLRGKWKVEGNGQAKADAQFLDGRKFNLSVVCTTYSFPPEALGQGQRGPLGGNLADTAQDMLDKVVASFEKLIDKGFQRDFLQKHLGIFGLKTAARPRNGQITLAAAQAALSLAKTGQYTRNEIRSVTRHPRAAAGGDDFVHVTPSEVIVQPDVALPETPTA
jgi:hypothetical protein